MEEFKDELSIFAESFNMHGPGAVGDNLEKGTRASPLSTGHETNANTIVDVVVGVGCDIVPPKHCDRMIHLFAL